jgi:tetratricopeptide (TPR) repeat protein
LPLEISSCAILDGIRNYHAALGDLEARSQEPEEEFEKKRIIFPNLLSLGSLNRNFISADPGFLILVPAWDIIVLVIEVSYRRGIVLKMRKWVGWYLLAAFMIAQQHGWGESLQSSTDFPNDALALYKQAYNLMDGMVFVKLDVPGGRGYFPPPVLNRANEAIELLKRAANLMPADPTLDYEIHYLLVNTFHHIEQHDQAIETGKSALKRLAGRQIRGAYIANLFSAVAAGQKEMGYMEEARQSLKAAVTAAPEYANPSLSLAELLYKINRPKEADDVLHELFVQAGGANGANANFLIFEIGRFYRKINQPTTACHYYSMAYQPDRVTDTNLYMALANTYEDLGNRQEALAIYQQLVEYFDAKGLRNDLGAREALTRLQKNGNGR